MPYNATTPEASDFGLGAWTFDPMFGITSASYTATNWYLSTFFWKAGEVGVAMFPSQILLPNVVVGSWTGVQLGIINQDQLGANAPGTLIASSVQTLPTAGITRQAITPTAGLQLPAVLPSGRYWVVLNTTGTTGTALAGPQATITSSFLGANAGSDVAHSRFGIASQTGTALGNITPSTIATTSAAAQQLCALIV